VARQNPTRHGTKRHIHRGRAPASRSLSRWCLASASRWPLRLQLPLGGLARRRQAPMVNRSMTWARARARFGMVRPLLPPLPAELCGRSGSSGRATFCRA